MISRRDALTYLAMAGAAARLTRLKRAVAITALPRITVVLNWVEELKRRVPDSI